MRIARFEIRPTDVSFGKSSSHDSGTVLVLPSTNTLCSPGLLRLVVLFALISVGAAHAQVLPPPPPDPFEPVTGKTQVLTTPEDRQPAIDLLSKVQRNFSVTMSGAPYTMKVSFTATGQTEFEGAGTMEALESLPNWSWSAHIAGISPARIGSNAHIYGNADPVPMRVQMLRSALFRPVAGFPNQKALRTATANLNGTEVTCVLLSGSIPKSAPPRNWWDREYCVDADGLLRMASEAVGIYAIYDYEDAIQFHGHVLPRNIKVVEGGATVLEVHVDSMADGVTAQDQSAFKLTPEMTSLGPTFSMGSPEWTPIRVDANPEGTLQRIEPVMIHATASHDTGKILEIEAMQNADPDLAAKAMDVVKQTEFPATGLQRELFVAVEFFIRRD